MFVGKPLVKKTFFKSFPKKKTLRLWISKIKIWIWFEESTHSVDFIKGFMIRFWICPTEKQNPFLDSEIRIWIFPKKRTHKLRIFFQL